MKKRKIVKLNRVEKALIRIAEEVEANPYNEYKLRKEVLGILGYKEIKPNA